MNEQLLTPVQIRAWALRVWLAMSPADRRLVAQALSGFELEEREAA